MKAFTMRDGTETVAEGMEFSDSTTVIRWLVDDRPATMIFASLAAVVDIYGDSMQIDTTEEMRV